MCSFPMSPCLCSENRSFLRRAFAVAELQGEGLVLAPIPIDFGEEISGPGKVGGECGAGER